MIAYALKEALAAMRRSKMTTFTATATLTVFMFLLGLFLLAYVNLSQLAAKIRERVQIEAFLSDAVGHEGVLALADTISAFSAVEAVSHVDKEMAREVFRQQFGDEALQALESNPLPASLKISLLEGDRTFSRVEQIAQKVAGLPGVVDVEYGRQWLSRLDGLLSTVRIVTVLLGLILAVSAVLIVATTVRLAFHVRAEAVEIMRLVGASPGFVARPFVVEGAAYGLLGGLLGLILLGLLHQIAFQRLAGLHFLPPALLLGLLLFGTSLGGLGSLISLRRMGRK